MQNLREYVGTVAAAGNGQFNRLAAMETLGDEAYAQMYGVGCGTITAPACGTMCRQYTTHGFIVEFGRVK